MTDVDSLDWKDPTPEQMTKTVLDKVTDGSIVLMHKIVLIKDLIPEGDYYTDVQGELHLADN